MKLLGLEFFYAVTGGFLLLVAGRIAVDRGHPKRWGSALFWALLALAFLAGKYLPPIAVGYMLLVMVALAATNQLGLPRAAGATAVERAAAAGRMGNRIFVPALLIPATAIIGTLLLSKIHWGDWWLLDPANATVTSVCLGAVVAVGVGLRLTGAPAATPVDEGSRL